MLTRTFVVSSAADNNNNHGHVLRLVTPQCRCLQVAALSTPVTSTLRDISSIYSSRLSLGVVRQVSSRMCRLTVLLISVTY